MHAILHSALHTSLDAMAALHASPSPKRLAAELEERELEQERASERRRRQRRRQRPGSTSSCSMRSARPGFSVATTAAAAAAMLGLSVGAAESSCEYERVTEQDGGSFEVPIKVGHTFDVPPADTECPQGEWMSVQVLLLAATEKRRTLARWRVADGRARRSGPRLWQSFDGETLLHPTNTEKVAAIQG